MIYNMGIMRKIIVEKNDKKIVNYIKKQFNNVPESAVYKALRQKDIRVNGVKISENVPVEAGDEITIYITDEILFGTKNIITSKSIIYNDENIVVVSKPKNILVQGNEQDIGLDKLINDYFGVTSIVPCHRLDRNTSGLILFAKNSESETIILDLIKNHKIEKYYKCLVYGQPKQKSATLKAYLFKDAKSNRVIISNEKKKGYVEIITKYTLLNTFKDGSSELEVQLITGRTHQIRAHLAFIGLPIIGDGKYGINQINKKFKKDWQELESYKLIFTDAYGKLEYLKGKTFTMKQTQGDV